VILEKMEISLALIEEKISFFGTRLKRKAGKWKPRKRKSFAPNSMSKHQELSRA